MELKNNKFNILLITVYIFIAVILMFNHELWRDETQVWCIVRDLNLFEIFQAARLEGHPILWYMLILPFAKLGVDVFSMQVISLLFVLASVIFFVFKAPFNNIVKTLVVMSSGMIYYLPVVARNYSLIPLFLFLLADLYPKRKEKTLLYSIILICLSNTHILMLGFSLIIAVLFIFENLKEKNKSTVLSVLLIILNFLFLFLMFNNMQNINHAVKFYSSNSLPLLPSLINFSKMYFLFPFTVLGNLGVCIFYSVIGVLLGYFLKFSKKQFVILLVSFVYIFYVYYKVWFEGITYQKAFLLLLIVLFCCWSFSCENKLKSKIITWIISIFFAFSAISSIFVSMLEINYPFSSAKQTADYIKANLNEQNKFIVIGYPFTFTSISAYLPKKKFYSYPNGYYISYYDFSKASKMLEDKPDCDYLIVQTNFYMDSDYEEIFKSMSDIISVGTYNETFRIYKKIK